MSLKGCCNQGRFSIGGLGFNVYSAVQQVPDYSQFTQHGGKDQGSGSVFNLSFRVRPFIKKNVNKFRVPVADGQEKRIQPQTIRYFRICTGFQKSYSIFEISIQDRIQKKGHPICIGFVDIGEILKCFTQFFAVIFRSQTENHSIFGCQENR